MGIPGVNLVVNPNPCLEKPALSHGGTRIIAAVLPGTEDSAVFIVI